MSQHNHHDSHEHEHGAPGHNHDYDHEHEHEHGFWEQLAHLLPWNGHRHDYTELAGDEALQSHEEGIRTVWLALGALLLTTLIQVVIVVLSGSVALLADTVHNLGDGLNSIPLLIAFYLARRAATRRYSYGFGRAEDVAGIFIVLSIAISAGVIFWESFQKFLDPEPITNLPWVVAAAIVGFVGNEAVALLQIRVGRKIGSAAMVADGLHARTDGSSQPMLLKPTAQVGLGRAIPLSNKLLRGAIGQQRFNFRPILVQLALAAALWPSKLLTCSLPGLHHMYVGAHARPAGDHVSQTDAPLAQQRPQASAGNPGPAPGTERDDG